MSKLCFRPSKPLFLENPFQELLPEYTIYCKRAEVDALHRHICKKLDIMDVYDELVWRFNDRLRAVYGQAEYWRDENKKMNWKIQYATKYWIPMGVDARRNIIIHEVCHLAVEKLYGHCA